MIIDHLRNQRSPQIDALRTPDRRGLFVIGDSVQLEVLQGMQTEARANAMERWLRCFVIMPMLDDHLAVQAARNYRLLRAHGVTIRKTAALVTGTFCIDRGWPLLHDGRDFTPMQRHLGLAVPPI